MDIWKNGISGIDSIADKSTYFFKDLQKKLI